MSTIDDYVASQGPEFAEGMADAENLEQLMDYLVSLRKKQGLTQVDVADRMRISQSRVSEFESQAGDPRLTTVMRYARAVGVKVQFTMEQS